MGRVKLKIKKLESNGNWQVTFSKRRTGILKKAKELSILCDVDISLLMFSPTGKSTLLQGERSNFEEIIAKFALLTPQERAKRKLETLEVLKKTFKKLDHDVNVQDFMSSSTQTVKDLTNQAMVLQAQLSELHKRLSLWSNPDKVENLEQLRQMEDMLKESINQIRLHKEYLGQHQLTSLNCTSQFSNGIPSSLLVDGMHETQPISWLLNNDNQPIVLTNKPNYLPHRDVECSTNVSVPQYTSYLNNGASTSTGKQSEVGDPGQPDNMGHILNMEGGGGLNEFGINNCVSTQLGGQYAFPSYCSSNVPDDKRLRPEMQINLPTNPVDYHASNNFELPISLYDNENHTWISSSGPSSIAVYKEDTYQHQQPNMRL